MAIPFSSDAAHVVEILRHRAAVEADKPAYTFLDRGERAVKTLSFGDLDRRARAIAAALPRADGGAQARALLIYPSGLEFIEAFWACLYARIIAVPAYPPRANSHGLPRLQAIIGDCAPEIVLSTQQNVQDAGESLAALGALRTLATDEVPDAAGDGWSPSGVRPADVAMLQYSSGSTASPKGIIVSHRNVQANQLMIAQAFQHSAASTFVGWLPFFHDMGLFGNIVQPLFIGAHSILMSPLSFLQKPVRWLQAISDYQAHTSGGPNFGYEYCVRRIRDDEKARLDLRSWRTAFNGAEKPRAETMRRFSEAFGPHGFQSRAFYPCYGLAEAVLFVTGRDRTRVPDITQLASTRTAGEHEASSGHGWHPQRLAIVHPGTGAACAEGETGEIWIGGPHIADGYWGQPALTTATFEATRRDDGEGPFLRTGDLGFLRDGELFVAGRLKDLIVLRGQNYHPEDIEATVESSAPALEPGQCAAFSVDAAGSVGERLVLLIEVAKTFAEEGAEAFCAGVAGVVSRTFGIAVGQIALVRRGGIPKTSSGKIQRFLCRQRFVAGELDPVALVTYDAEPLDADDDAAWEATRQELRGQQGEARETLIRERLYARLHTAMPHAGAETLAPDASLVQNGLDSVRAVELKHWIARALGADLSIVELFELPSIRELVALIAARLALTADGANAEAAQAVDAAIEPDRVSSGQEALFFEYEKDPASAAYNISVAVELSGPIERPRIAVAVERLLRRHPHLAATFVRQDASVHQMAGRPNTAEPKTAEPNTAERSAVEQDADGPVAVVATPHDQAASGHAGHLEIVDAGAWPRERLAREVGARANAPFDLRASALRVVLYEIDADRAVLLLVVHHILIDLLSLELLLRELASGYASDPAPRTDDPRAVAVTNTGTRDASSYAAFIAWQRRFIDSPEGERSLAFWRDLLDGARTTPRLACAPQTAAAGRSAGRVHTFEVGPADTAALKAYAARAQATPSMVLFAAYAVLLAQLLREPQVVIGSTVVGRPDQIYARTPGYFANVLPLPMAVDVRRTFGDLLADVRRLFTRALDHQHYPFSRLVERLGARPDGAANPASSLRYAFTFGPSRQDARIFGLLREEPDVRVPFGALTATGFPIEREMAPFEMTLMVLDREDRFDAAFCHLTPLIDADVIATLADAYRACLSALVQAPDRPIRQLPVRPPAVVAAAGAHDRSVRAPASAEPFVPVIERFARQARLRPDATALRDGRTTLTYREANRRADRIARDLRNAGVGPEARVAVCCPRGVHMVIAILGIAKAGAAYVPIDMATFPPERVQAVVRHAGASIVLTVASAAGACASLGCDVVSLDVDEARAPLDERPVPPAPLDRDHLAYIIYTSGSTGQPKGVELTQGNIARLFDRAQPYYGFGPEDSWLLFHSIAFDVSVWEMWGALSHGGSLTIPDHAATRDPEAVLAHVLDEQVTVLCQTPSAFYNLLPCLGREARAARGLPTRAIVFAGEALKYEQLAPWFERSDAARVRLVNMYGITETTVHTTLLEVQRRHLDDPSGSAVGRCLDDFTLHLLTPSHQRLPDGALGEIALGGPGVARGYRGQPALTAARFVPDPFDEAIGARMYLSGDLAYTRRGGEVWHMGRSDRQVKIRGHRIELGEIELHVRACPGVEWALVLVEEADDAVRSLAAYVKAAADVTVARLHEHLARRVPEYMIPSAFLRVRAIPTNANGKVDVAAVRAGADPLDRGGLYVAPRTEAERLLARIWAEVLRVEHVGIDDNYFELGGDSIRSIRVASKAKQAGLPIDLPQLLAAQTIRRLCAPLATRASAAPIAWSQPFELVHAEDRGRLPAGLEDAFPVDTLLQGLMFHAQFSDDYQIYVTSFLVRTPWRRDRLEAAIAAVVARHPFLRSSIDTTSYSEPLQLVHPDGAAPLTVDDWRAQAPGEQARRLRAWIEGETRHRFDWTQAPLVRFAVHLRSDETFQLTLSEPYLDGWCVASLFRELFERYLAPPPAAPPLRMTQRHFVQLERAAIGDEESRQFWRRFLEACPDSRLSRVNYSQAPPHKPHDRRVLVLPPELVSRLELLARRASVPLRSVFVSAHAQLLAALIGQRDVVFGVILNGRPEEEDSDQTIGSFLNAVPFRIAVDPRESWTAWLDRLFATEREIWPHRRMPFAEIQKIRGAAVPFETVFNFTDFHALEDLRGRDDFTMLDAYASEQTFFPLTAHVNRSILNGQLELLLDYDCAAVSAAQVELVADGFLTVLQSMAADAGQPGDGAGAGTGGVAEASARLTARLFPAPCTAVVPEADAAARSAPAVRAPSVVELIDRQAVLSPDRIAIISDTDSVTFRTLKARTDALAHWLREGYGVDTDVRVGLHTRRSLSGLIGLLAILKAGGAYVPIDESCPAPRLAWQLADSGAACVLTDDALASRVEALGLPVWSVDRRPPEGGDDRPRASRTGAAPRTALRPPDAEALAYIIYTSGSTGVPKGVEVSHRALAQLAASAMREYAIQPDDRILQFATFEFDISVEEIVMGLCAGATLVLRPPDLLDSFAMFRDVCVRQAITCLDLPTAFWHEWVSELASTNGERGPATGAIDPALRLVIIGGEAMRRDRGRQWMAIAPPSVGLVNTYGPTEATVTTTRHWVTPEGELPEAEAARGVSPGSPIGAAIGHPIVTILDRAQRPVAPGIHGELTIGGPGVARGYHARPALTAERFTPDPAGTFPGARRYATGDIACRLPDGDVWFVGRLDHQIKIRGYRVELGEIEAALRLAPGVSQAVVCARETDGQASGLDAYVQLDAAIDAAAGWDERLRDHLTRTLPAYMVPARIHRVAQWPMSVTGKIDRRALAALDAGPRVAPAVPAADGAQPDTVFRTLADICETCLRVDGVRPDDDFFALGGDSLTAMRVVSRARAALPCVVSVRDIFEAPQLGSLARLLTRRIATAPVTDAEEAREAPADDGEEVLSFAQERLWMAEQLSFNAPAYNLPASLVIRGPFNRAAFEQAMREIHRRHRVLQTRLVLDEGRLRPVVDAAHTLDVRDVDVSAVTDAADDVRLERARAEHVERPFDLACDLPVRIALFSANDTHHQLSIALHHIVADGWSIELLIRELGELYAAFAGGRPSPLAPLPLQYVDYARRQRATLQGAHKARLVDYWETTLAGMPDQVELPWDYERPVYNTFAGARHYFTIPRAVVETLERLGRADGTTVFTLLLTAYTALLHRRSDQTDIVVGTPVSNRDWPETEQLIGLFVNQVAVRTDLSGEPSYRQLLRRVRTSLVSACAHGDLPFEELVTALRPRRDAGRLPLVQTIFTYWDRPWQDFTLDGLELTFPEVHQGTAKYDLEVQLIDRRAAGVRGYFEYDVHLFHPDTIRGLAEEYAGILDGFADRLDQPIRHRPARPASVARRASPSMEAR